jgi:hypothetical protein
VSAPGSLAEVCARQTRYAPTSSGDTLNPSIGFGYLRALSGPTCSTLLYARLRASSDIVIQSPCRASGLFRGTERPLATHSAWVIRIQNAHDQFCHPC